MKFHSIFNIRHSIFNISLVAAFAAANVGCVSEDAATTRAISSLITGMDTNAVVWAHELATDSHYSKTLGMVELGRVRMLGGDFGGSLRAFNAAVDTAMDRNERQPVIKLGDVGNTVLAATITDDRTRQYYLPAYEFNLALQYTILDDLFLGRHEDAMVDARRAVYAQDQLADKYGADVAAARADAATNSNGSASLGAADKAAADMAPVLEQTRNSWENAALWWLTGLLFEADRDAPNAAVSYRKAYELAPSNPFVAADYRRLAVKEGVLAAPVASAAVRSASSAPMASLVLFYDESFVSRRRAVKVVVPIYTAVDVDIPVYQDKSYVPSVVTLAGVAGGRASPALDVQSLAYRDLKEKLPGIITRAVTRAAGQVAAQYGANTIAHNQSSDGAALAIMAGAFAANAIVSAIRDADTRTWATLPMMTQIYRGPVAAGKGTLVLQANGRALEIPLMFAPGETRLVYVADIGGSCRVATATLAGKGTAPTYFVGPSLLGVAARGR